MTDEPERVHEPGECPTGYKFCDGIEDFGEDPYLEEIYGDHSYYWMCPGVSAIINFRFGVEKYR